jgi:predicted nucleic acid-binding protein
LSSPTAFQTSARVNELYLLLSRYPNLDWVEPGLEIADRAARMRAEHRLGVPDALQAATAMARQATGFISNDKAFQRVTPLDVLVLDHALTS